MKQTRLIKALIIALPILAVLWAFTDNIAWGVIMVFDAILIHESITHLRYKELLVLIKKKKK